MCFLNTIFNQARQFILHVATILLEFIRPQRWIQWKPTSMAQLVQVEQKILKCVKSVVDTRFVTVKTSESRIWTVTLNKHLETTPLVMVHGMGGGLGLWVQNMDVLSANRPVYTFDLLGFGRSSRPTFSTDPRIAEFEFVSSIEDWRKEVKLDNFILLGHSLGAYVCASYALQHPKHIKHLILVDPWGFPEKPPDNQIQRRVPGWIRMIATFLQPFNPLAGLRVAGPLGPGLVRRFRPDLQAKFSGLFDDDTIFEYIYHCNAQKPRELRCHKFGMLMSYDLGNISIIHLENTSCSVELGAIGETAFKAMQMSFGWAKFPMMNRIVDVDNRLPMTFIHGSRSWIDQQIGHHVKKIRSESYVAVQNIPGAGHHVYADKPQLFNTAIKKICENVDTFGNSSWRNRNDSERICRPRPSRIRAEDHRQQNEEDGDPPSKSNDIINSSL